MQYGEDEEDYYAPSASSTGGGGLFGGGFGGLGGTMTNLSQNPFILAALQMAGNNTPQIGKIPNTFANVPQVLMAGNQQQRAAAAEARAIAQKQAELNAMTEALTLSDTTLAPDIARRLAPSLPGVKIYLEQQEQKRQAKQLEDYYSGAPKPDAGDGEMDEENAVAPIRPAATPQQQPAPVQQQPAPQPLQPQPRQYQQT